LIKNNYNLQKYKSGCREKFIEKVYKQIELAESFLVSGMPGSGKTDLFQNFGKNNDFWPHLYPKREIDFIVIFLDTKKLLDITPHGFYRFFINCLYTTIQKLLQDKIVLKNIRDLYFKSMKSMKVTDMSVIFNLAEEILRILVEETDYKICVFIHDFGSLLKFKKEFFNSLRALRDINKWRIIYGFSCDRDLSSTLLPDKLDELYSLFLNRKIWLPLLTKKDSYLIMEEWENEHKYKIPDNVKEKIYDLAQGHPGYMKSLNSIYQTDKKVSLFDDIQKLMKRSAIKSRNDKFWTKLIDQYKDFLIEFAHNPKTKINSRGEYLQKAGVLVQEGENFKIFSPLLEGYIKTKENKQKKAKVETTSKDSLLIDSNSGTIFVDGKSLKSEPTVSEFKILNLLFKNKGKIVDRDTLAKAIWGPHSVAKYSDWAIDRTISRIRKKIGDSATNPRFIQTVRGRGLRLI
jgi:DNA-binding winged helix-turn-helix (wHTH) protein